MTLDQSVALCRTWLYRLDPTHKEAWRSGLPNCTRPNCRYDEYHHDIPMPPASWELAGAMLERYRGLSPHTVASVHAGYGDETKDWICELGFWGAESVTVTGHADNPCDAILLAAASYIEAQK